MYNRPNEREILTTKKQKLPVKVGDIVTFAVLPNKDLNEYLPRIERVRYDLQWEDVVSNSVVF